jgi:hypothetical protein
MNEEDLDDELADMAEAEDDEKDVIDERVELAAFLGDEVSRRRCIDAGHKLPDVDNQPKAWVAGLCTMAKRWPPELARQATGRAALIFTKIAIQGAGERDAAAAGEPAKRLLAAAQKALTGDKVAAHKDVADVLKPDLLAVPEPAKGLRAAALLTFQQALQGKPDPTPLSAIADTFMKTAGAENAKAVWRALKAELKDQIVPWALGRLDPLAK